MSSRIPYALMGPAAIVLLLVAAPQASATFTRATSVTQGSAVTSATLGPPTGPTGSCKGQGSATITWTASNRATSYTLSWTGASSGQATVATTTYSTTLTTGTYNVTIAAKVQNWTSANASFTFTC